jgi:hypothetical protein
MYQGQKKILLYQIHPFFVGRGYLQEKAERATVPLVAGKGFGW